MVTKERRPKKTATLQFRVNPGIRDEAERVFSDCGLTMSEAFHAFLKQSINVGGLPFLLVTDAKSILKRQAEERLFAALEAGETSARRDGWISSDDVEREFGVSR